jgi:hypothetical protein
MKHYLFIFLVLCLALACTPTATTENGIDRDLASVVQNNLIPEVFFAGDSTWSIDERMAFYGVPGVSLAVIHDNNNSFFRLL